MQVAAFLYKCANHPEADSAALSNEADTLLNYLETTLLATILSTSHPRRAQYGDLIQRQALICRLLSVAFQLSPRHPRIQQNAAALLELLIEATSITGSLVNCLFALVIAAGLVPEEDHPTIIRLFGTLR